MSGHKVTRQACSSGVLRDLGPQAGHLGAVAPNALLPKKKETEKIARMDQKWTINVRMNALQHRGKWT